MATVMVGLIAGNALSLTRLRRAERELASLRSQVGYLDAQPADRAAAVRVPVDEPLTYRFRVRVPDPTADSPANKWATTPDSPQYRLVYSTVFLKDQASPRWYGALAVAPGESVVTVRVAPDPRDGRWKVSLVVRGQQHTRRIGTTLPREQEVIFRGSHDVIATGIGRQTVAVPPGGNLRLLDDRWLAGEGGSLLYGERPVVVDQIGLYVQFESLGPGRQRGGL